MLSLRLKRVISLGEAGFLVAGIRRFG